MVDWGEFHHWRLRDGAIKTRNADNQACGHVYIDLFLINKDSSIIKPIKENIDNMLLSDKVNDWLWIDCLQMSMPVFLVLELFIRMLVIMKRCIIYTYLRGINME
jgi:unsaturated rhamnogalacturonyl hydrolase